MKPSLTIGMPVFNDIDFIEESLQSILNQTYEEFVLIISDDNSNDGSGEVCRRYEQTDSRITYIRQENNIGISRNMEFLLSLANTKYFMWAGDDDLLAPTFIEKLLPELSEEKNIIVSFGTFISINEKSEPISKTYNFNYSAVSARERLTKYITQTTDSFGYGIFLTEKIKNVRFPVWHWPNRKTPYNNILPTLCYYLAVGNYSTIESDVLWYKRLKSKKNTNHHVTFSQNSFLNFFSFVIRRINLVNFTFISIMRAKNAWLAISIFPLLWYHWFFKTVGSEFKQIIKNKFYQTNHKPI